LRTAVEGTREGDIDQIDSLGFDYFLGNLHSLDDGDRDIKSYALWCATDVLRFSKNSRHKIALKAAKAYFNNTITSLQLQKEHSLAETYWLKEFNKDKKSVETQVASTIMTVCQAMLSTVDNAALWGYYHYAIHATTFCAACAARAAVPEEYQDLAWKN
jgi:hypothetical protein